MGLISFPLKLFIFFRCSSPPDAHRHELLPAESERGRPADVVAQLFVQLYLHAQLGLAVRGRLLHHQQLYGQHVGGVVRLHAGRHLTRSVRIMFVLFVCYFFTVRRDRAILSRMNVEPN